ncbi:type III pantothenate kinase [Pikeienuella piscinae]|uniref:Type III pantothenate kinase n=1 Tax=Pikeienuella piscinae TaxID=2748098 RepID=A0A7L5BTE0_9RHOB|nr:type III pantothenate kinase [Pikeienuella piscinae]QIE54251.1 type III pantothenate kinase [Pikeienuella piscinae]
MLLAIDAGNTNTVFAVFDGDRLLTAMRCSTYGPRTSDEYFVWLNRLMDHHGVPLEAITDAIIATVVPQTLFNLKRLCREFFKCEPLVVGEPNCALGVKIKVKREREVGADRLVNTVGAFDAYGPNLIIVDFGTATTFDVVDFEGAYAGGLIVPGVNLSLKALHEAAAKLPNVDIAKPQQVVGTDTESCMQSGVYWGYVSLIEGVCKRVSEEIGVPMTVIATGGLSPLMAEGTLAIDHVDGDLTMRGLVKIYKENRP